MTLFGTVGPITPSVQYAYTEMLGGVNNSRLISMTYPNGRVLNSTGNNINSNDVLAVVAP